MFFKYNCREAEPETELHTNFVFQGVNIENHKIIVAPNSEVKELVNAYLLLHTNDVVFHSDGYYTFPTLPNLVYLMMHALNHVNYASENTILPLKHIVDLGMFIHKNRFQLSPEDVFRTMQELKLDKSFELIVYLSEWMLHIDLKEYHQDLIKPKDLRQIDKLFNKQGLSVPLERYPTLIKQSCAIWKRYRTLKPISKYIPVKPKRGLFRITNHMQWSFFLRRLFNLPEEGSVKENLKKKFANRKG